MSIFCYYYRTNISPKYKRFYGDLLRQSMCMIFCLPRTIANLKTRIFYLSCIVLYYFLKVGL